MCFYSAYELIIQSAIALPGFNRVTAQRADVVIRRQLTDFPIIGKPGRVDEKKTEDGVRFICPFGVLFEITNGNKITLVANSEQRSELEILPLYGFAIAAVLHQRGVPVFHASSVAIGMRGVVIVGEKGTGKSSLAMSLLARGSRLLSDDVTGLCFNETGLEILPGVASIKLWPDSMHAVGIDPNLCPQLHAETEKKHYLVGTESFCGTRIKLKAIIILARADIVKIEELFGREKLLFLLGNYYLSRFYKALSQEEKTRAFSECSEIAQKSKIIKISRPSDLLSLSDTAKLVEEIILA